LAAFLVSLQRQERKPEPTTSTNTTPFILLSLNSKIGEMTEEIVHHEAIQQYIGQLATLEREFDALDVQIRNSALPSFLLLTPDNFYRVNT